jgi:hypothetical protein
MITGLVYAVVAVVVLTNRKDVEREKLMDSIAQEDVQ